MNLQKDLVRRISEITLTIKHKAQQNKRQFLHLPIPKNTVWEMLNQTETSGFINESTRSKVAAERVPKDKGALNPQQEPQSCISYWNPDTVACLVAQSGVATCYNTISPSYEHKEASLSGHKRNLGLNYQ